jgi:hypothetical protein
MGSFQRKSMAKERVRHFRISAGKTAVCFGRIVTEVYTYFVECFKDFIFRKRLLLLALIAHRMHRKR